MKSFLTWKSFKRDETPELLQHGFISKPSKAEKQTSTYLLEAGFINDHNNGSEPMAIVVPEENQLDFFSWISTFSPENFPISQVKRVLGKREIPFLTKLLDSDIRESTDKRWASIIVGEMLALGETEQDIASVPLSRYLGCFSTAVARTDRIYHSPEANKICIQRLVSLEADKRFVPRTVTTSDLSYCWTMYENNKSRPLSLEFLTGDFTKQLCIISSENNATEFHEVISNELLAGLLDNSIEKRVIAFNSILKSIYESKPRNKLITGAFIAAAVFLVGRGTSHIHLLKKFAKDYPSSFVWIGVISALISSKNQDIQWKRITKSIERFIDQSFQIDEPVLVDLCWAEYIWASNYASEYAFSDIPKLYPRTLSIEIFPGASCQLRLASSTSPKAAETNESHEAIEKLRRIESSVDDLIGLAIKIKQATLVASQRDEPIQGSLLPVPTIEAKAKTARNTKTKTVSRARKTNPS